MTALDTTALNTPALDTTALDTTALDTTGLDAARPATPPTQARRVVPTTAGYKALVDLHARRGPVVLVEPGHDRAGHHRVDCLPARDFAISPADRLVGAVDLCAVYVDADADDREHRPVYLVDVAEGPASEATLAPDAGHHLVLRRLGAPDGSR